MADCNRLFAGPGGMRGAIEYVDGTSSYPCVKSPKQLFQKNTLTLKFKIPNHNSIMLWAGILNFKFRIVFWNMFFGDWEIWEKNSHFLKKTTFR